GGGEVWWGGGRGEWEEGGGCGGVGVSDGVRGRVYWAQQGGVRARVWGCGGRRASGAGGG
ncbi:hypothetical protein UF35_02105, partial [Vibrio parahaemolyticus]